MTAAEDSVIPEFMEKPDLMGYAGNYRTKGNDVYHDSRKHKIMFRGIMASSKNQTGKLKSITGLSIWIVDEAAEMASEDDFDTINLSIRQKGVRNIVIIILNPEHVSHWIWQKFFKGRMPDGKDVPNEFNGVIHNVRYIHTTYLENLENVNPDWIKEAILDRQYQPEKYKRLWLGHWQKELSGALWTHDMIKRAKELEINDDDLEVVCVSVDPSVSSSGEQDECGIVVCGRTEHNFKKCLEDRSGVMPPAEWAKQTIWAFILNDADYIVAEVNNGGDLVEMNIRNAADEPEFKEYGIDKDSIPIEMVRATKGKLVRADPVATEYARGKWSHAPGLEPLEEQLTTYTGGGEKSPGRLDALVWGGIFLSKATQPRIRGT
jgi:hypothetical protein